jgi:hypothetical protein
MGRNSNEGTVKQKQAMILLLEASKGDLELAIKEAGISERTHYRWCREDRGYRNAANSIRDIQFRRTKEKLLAIAMKKIEDGNTPTLNKMLGIFYKDFGEELRLSNLYNDDPYEKPEDNEY